MACSDWRHVADLVEEQGAAGRGLDLARGLFGGAGECTLLVAEQLTLQQVLGNRRAVDGDETVVMDGLSPCSEWASNSLPVPDSPSISTLVSVGATFSTVRQACSMRHCR